MNVIHAAKDLKIGGKKVCLAIGFFDGVHLGHQQIIRQTVADARRHDAVALVLTFDRHPNAVVASDRVPPLIYSLPQKLRSIESLGADALLLIHFDKKFSRQTGEEFIRGLVRDFGNIHSICVGADFVFGRRRSGNVALLKKLGGELGFIVHGIAAVSLKGRIVSSTRIRKAIGAGDLGSASQMLGRPCAICGPVIKGNRLGRRLGFPTANLDVSGLILPPNGIYAGLARVRNKSHRVAMSIGFRPTIAPPSRRLHVEAYLLDFHGNLYGKQLEVEIGRKLRDEKKFSSLDKLKAQIARDVAAARKSAAI